ncbi:MAG: hypothetical protein RLZZ383_507 [Pseudomonadota bacterium]|jgi:hypothetical protein
MRPGRTALQSLLVVGSWACQTPNAPAPDASGTAPRATALPAPRDVVLPERVGALIGALQASVPDCAARLRAVSPEAAGSSPLPFDAATLDADCADAGAVYDAHGRPALYLSRGATRLAEAAARLGDDLEYLHRAMGGPASERRNAIEHLHAALQTVDTRLAEPAEVYDSAYAYPPRGDASAYAPAAETDATELDACARSLKNLVFDQGFDKESVRRRMLEVRGAAVLADLAARDAALDAANHLADADRARLRRDADVTRHAVETYEAAWRAFAAGEVRDAAERDRWRTLTDGAFRAAGRVPP